MTSIRQRTKSKLAGHAAAISQTAEYALRAMAHLARPNAEAMRASDLSRATSVPVHYLSKVLRRLVHAGLLTSQKGHGGGFSLSRPASAIRFADVLAAVDETPVADHCAFGWDKCDARHPCPLHPAWAKLNEQMAVWADQTTLADVATQSLVRPRPKNGSTRS